jgi:hypothetical protein
MGRREAGRQWRRALLAPVQEEEEDGRLGRVGELGRPRGRGPVGKGKNGRLKRKENGHGWAESDGKILFWIKFDFWIYQGFENLHKDIYEEFWHEDLS